MITPAKHIRNDRALLAVGARILAMLDRPRTVSSLWDSFRAEHHHGARVTYDWFVLALDLLFIIGALKIEGGLLVKANA